MTPRGPAFKSVAEVEIVPDVIPKAVFGLLATGKAVGATADSVYLFPSDTIPRRVTVLTDATTGKLLKIVVTTALTGVGADYSTMLDTAEQRLFDRGYCAAGLPDSIIVSFVNALRSCPDDPSESGRITGIYVLDSCARNQGTIPVWIIAMTDHPSEPMMGVPGVPDSLLDRYGYTKFVVGIDARTGRPLWSRSY